MVQDARARRLLTQPTWSELGPPRPPHPSSVPPAVSHRIAPSAGWTPGPRPPRPHLCWGPKLLCGRVEAREPCSSCEGADGHARANTDSPRRTTALTQLKLRPPPRDGRSGVRCPLCCPPFSLHRPGPPCHLGPSRSLITLEAIGAVALGKDTATS
ncbi:hypothetical protein HJG60_009453 [Phyllostomus discolor]|uniref:Uncharacterized protein n=1 Tax=Phyllostomus discolor TaxID=89673 RepID=A0A834D8Y1_9CHIR|nr:hypothetical protein HJG60_009453 [Phyllostomus discolor]